MHALRCHYALGLERAATTLSFGRYTTTSRPWRILPMTATTTRSRLALCCLWALALGTTTTFTSRVAGQHMVIASSVGGYTQIVAPGRFSNLLRPDYTRRDLKVILQELQITHDQRFVLEVLLDDYTESFNQAVQQFKAVRERFDGPDRPLAHLGSEGAKQMAETLLKSVEDNLANTQIVQLEGGEGVFVGILQHSVDGEGGTWTGSAGEGGEGQIKMHIAVLASVEEDHEGHEAGTHTIPPEVLERLHNSLRERLEERLAERRDELAKAVAEIEAREARREAGEEEEASADDVAEAARTLLAQRTQLKEEFENDLMLLLPKEQAEAWPGVERHLRRLNTLSKGQFAGESLDLYRLLDESLPGASDQQPTATTLKEYELRLDDTLSERNHYLTESEIDTFLAWAEQDFDTTLALIERESDLRLAVRDVNDEFIQTIASGLDASQAVEFRQAARRAAYRSVYRTMREQRLFAQAKEIDGLDPDVLDAVTNLETAYLQELAVANDQLVEATRENQPGQKKRMIEMMQQFRSGSMQLDRLLTNPIIDAHRQRRSLGQRYAKQLKSILTTEQFESLPAAKPQQFGSITIQRGESN